MQRKKNGSFPDLPAREKPLSKYGWVFTIKKTSDVHIYTKDSGYLDVPTKTIVKENIIYQTKLVNGALTLFKIVTKYSEFDGYPDIDFIGSSTTEETKEIVKICSLRDHPDCCGAKLLFNFCQANHIDYSRYKSIKPEHHPSIKEYFDRGASGRLAHIAQFQECTITLLEELGFKRIHSYKNRNGGNMIHMYQLD